MNIVLFLLINFCWIIFNSLFLVKGSRFEVGLLKIYNLVWCENVIVSDNFIFMLVENVFIDLLIGKLNFLR